MSEWLIKGFVIPYALADRLVLGAFTIGSGFKTNKNTILKRKVFYWRSIFI